MTKRRIKNQGPTGFNRSLGNSLVNQGKAKRVYVQPNIAKAVDPEKVLDSVTHESNLEEFLTNAELAERDFTAEKGEFRIISASNSTVVNTDDLVSKSFEELASKYGELLKIPRRPARGTYETAEELNKLENQMFLDWRRNVSLLQESHGVVMTPFERNLELWRQLWRVIERSDLIVQIVDARNPLLFRSADLEEYVKEVDPSKGNILLVNKSDLLSPEHIEKWREYFRTNNIPAVFWSAKPSESNTELAPVQEQSTEDEEDESSSDEEEAGTSSSNAVEAEEEKSLETAVSEVKIEDDVPFIRSAAELISYFKSKAFACKPGAEQVVVGMVGYPNVGKSSTINRIYGSKKTSVSSTPGKTKHFQTLVVDEELMLCDCPGLVMPSFGFSTSEMVLNCVLPVDRTSDYFSPVQLLANRVPRKYFEALYSILLPKPADHENPDRPPTAHELLTTVAFMKGFMSSAGIPDCSRAARVILKDVVNGKLRWIASPPETSQEDFDKITFKALPERKQQPANAAVALEQLEKRHLFLGDDSRGKQVDDSFFREKAGAAHVSGRGPFLGNDGRIRLKKGKKDKLRRVYKHLDA